MSLRAFVGGFTVVVIGLIAGNLRPIAAQDDAARPAFYTERVKPIFQANCFRCHGGMNRRGGLNFETHAGLIQGGHHGAAIVPGDPANSLLVKLIRHEGPKDDPMDMPPKRDKLSDADIATVTRWIKAGAIMPPDVPRP
jgi:mono/diheme cytochrome c family protein